MKPQYFSRRPATVEGVFWDGSAHAKAALIEMCKRSGVGVEFLPEQSMPRDMAQPDGWSKAPTFDVVITRRWLELGEAKQRNSRYQRGVWILRDLADGLIFKAPRSMVERDFVAVTDGAQAADQRAWAPDNVVLRWAALRQRLDAGGLRMPSSEELAAPMWVGVDFATSSPPLALGIDDEPL